MVLINTFFGMVLFETLYVLMIAVPSIYIFSSIWKIYSFSSYRGLKYLAMAFLFFASGFIVRYVIMGMKIFSNNMGTIKTFGILTFIMEVLLMLPGFLILYSLIWRKIEKKHYAKEINLHALCIYLIVSGIAFVDTLTKGFYGMYFSQILVFAIALGISIKRYSDLKNNFRQMYILTMVLFLVVWIINLAAQYTIDSLGYIRVYTYLLTVGGCMSFLYITQKLTKGFR